MTRFASGLTISLRIGPGISETMLRCLPGDADFVIMSDLNADPFDGESVGHAARILLEHPRVAGDFTPNSDGAIEAANRQRRANDSHQGDPAYDTADFSDFSPGNFRTD
jgi:hypothetical protein